MQNRRYFFAKQARKQKRKVTLYRGREWRKRYYKNYGEFTVMLQDEQKPCAKEWDKL